MLSSLRRAAAGEGAEAMCSSARVGEGEGAEACSSYQLRAAWGATGQLSGIRLGLWVSRFRGCRAKRLYLHRNTPTLGLSFGVRTSLV